MFRLKADDKSDKSDLEEASLPEEDERVQVLGTKRKPIDLSHDDSGTRANPIYLSDDEDVKRRKLSP